METIFLKKVVGYTGTGPLILTPGLLKGYGFLRCYREGKAEARMKLCQTEMVEVDLLRKQ